MNSASRGTLFLSLALLAAGCSAPTDLPATFFTIRVDSLQVPSTVALNDTIAVRLFGVVGYDGCHSFSHFLDTREPLRLDLTVRGRHRTWGLCTDMMVVLDGREYRLVASRRGTLRLVIHQPDGSTLAGSVQVQ